MIGRYYTTAAARASLIAESQRRCQARREQLRDQRRLALQSALAARQVAHLWARTGVAREHVEAAQALKRAHLAAARRAARGSR